jgi:hypothetical protein
MSNIMGCRAKVNLDHFKGTAPEKGERTKAVIEAKDQIDTPCSRRETTLAFGSLGGRTEIAQTPLASGAPIGINARHYETHDHLSDHELWEKLRKSGRRNVSSREFIHRPSTRVDKRILQNINSSCSRYEDNASLRANHASVPGDHTIKLEWKYRNIHDQDSLGNTHLHRAVMEGASPSVIEFLINKGIEVNSVNKAKETPLFLAAARGKADLVAVLLKRGGHPNIRSSTKADQKKRKKKRNFLDRLQYRQERNTCAWN